MDKNSKRRVGRPKATPPSGPLVMQGSRARMKMELPLVEATANELKEYARWVELSSAVTTTDALFATVDFALRDVFRRDRLWQEQRRKTVRPSPAAAPSASQPAPAVASSPLPPPVSSARPVPTFPGSPVSRETRHE